MGYGEGGVSLLSRLGSLGERRELPWRVRGRTLSENRRCILKATERSFLYTYMTKSEGTISISVSLLQILWELFPSAPVIYAHVASSSLTLLAMTNPPVARSLCDS